VSAGHLTDARHAKVSIMSQYVRKTTATTTITTEMMEIMMETPTVATVVARFLSEEMVHKLHLDICPSFG
jgi:hypothetical protein